MPPRFGQLLGATVVCATLEPVLAGYGEALGYRGPVALLSSEQADRWGAPEAAGLRCATLLPEAGGPRFVRFVECPGAAPPPAHATGGWNAVELIVRDLDRLADRLAARADFVIAAPPAVLEFDFTDQIRAMQVLGPAGEMLYLTEVSGPVPGFDLPVPRCAVDLPFVAILGTTALDAARAFYGDGSELAVFAAPITVVSAAHDLDPRYRHRLTTAVLPSASLIEIDELPHATTRERVTTNCGLPAGIAMMTVAGQSLRMWHGPAGEWIEAVPDP